VSEVAELTDRHSRGADAADERQRGGHVGEPASSQFVTAASRTRPTSDSEEIALSELASSPIDTAASRTRPTSDSEETA
jgi:hypothetical protein